MVKLYRILPTKAGDRDSHYVQRIRDRQPVFFGSRQECEEWIERNGHDDAD